MSYSLVTCPSYVCSLLPLVSFRIAFSLKRMGSTWNKPESWKQLSYKQELTIE